MPSNPFLIDGHLDLAYLAVIGRDLLADRAAPGGCVTLPALCRAGVRLALATIFTESGVDPATNAAGYRDADEARRAGLRQLQVYRELESQGVLRIVRSRADLDAVGPSAPLSILLLMECADPIRDADDASWWIDAGVRAVGLSWARGSRFAGGNGAPGPLTSAGRELVAALDELGVIHDLSHLSDEGADELLSLARGPIVASHSNARALMGDGQRHLPDRLIREVAARRGVVGLNLYGAFLRSKAALAGTRPTIDDAVAHVRHVAEIGRVETIALGSDLDGGFGPESLPEGLDSPEKLPQLLDALLRAGFDGAALGAFAHGNWLRVLRTALP